MNDPHVSEHARQRSPDETRSALFAQMVMQQSSMAMMLLGKTAHPETGEMIRDLEAARFFIDQLEMLEFKTKGNLNHGGSRAAEAELDVVAHGFCGIVDSPPPPAEPRPRGHRRLEPQPPSQASPQRRRRQLSAARRSTARSSPRSIEAPDGNRPWTGHEATCLPSSACISHDRAEKRGKGLSSGA